MGKVFRTYGANTAPCYASVLTPNCCWGRGRLLMNLSEPTFWIALIGSAMSAYVIRVLGSGNAPEHLSRGAKYVIGFLLSVLAAIVLWACFAEPEILRAVFFWALLFGPPYYLYYKYGRGRKK